MSALLYRCGVRWRQLTTVIEGVERIGERLITASTQVALMAFDGFAVLTGLRMLTKGAFHHLMPQFNGFSLAKPPFLDARPAHRDSFSKRYLLISILSFGGCVFPGLSVHSLELLSVITYTD